MYALPLNNILILLHFVWQNGTMNVCENILLKVNQGQKSHFVSYVS